jgi:hypothetical protein
VTDSTEPTPPTETTPTEATQSAEPAQGVERTGDPRVDSALDRLDAVENAPLVDHVAAYDEVHRLLQDALADVDQG